MRSGTLGDEANLDFAGSLEGEKMTPLYRHISARTPEFDHAQLVCRENAAARTALRATDTNSFSRQMGHPSQARRAACLKGFRSRIAARAFEVRNRTRTAFPSFFRRTASSFFFAS